MKGRKPKSTHLHELQGTRPSAPRHGEPQAAGQVGPPPEFFTASQATLWREYRDSAPAGVLKAVDAAIFSAFVIAVDAMNQAAAILSREGITVATERGGSVENPASRALARYALIVAKTGAECGFSPASRPRISVPPAQTENPFLAFRQKAEARREELRQPQPQVAEKREEMRRRAEEISARTADQAH